MSIKIVGEHIATSIASVQQTSFLFNNSVLENIHLGRLGSDYEDILEASKASGAEKFIEEMPDRYMTELAEDGSNLSGGQRQRLAIARALVRDADIMLFDEATSALDNETKEHIKDTIYKSCQGRTGLIIAHRLNTLSYCQRLAAARLASYGDFETKALLKILTKNGGAVFAHFSTDGSVK